MRNKSDEKLVNYIFHKLYNRDILKTIARNREFYEKENDYLKMRWKFENTVECIIEMIEDAFTDEFNEDPYYYISSAIEAASIECIGKFKTRYMYKHQPQIVNHCVDVYLQYGIIETCFSRKLLSKEELDIANSILTDILFSEEIFKEFLVCFICTYILDCEYNPMIDYLSKEYEVDEVKL